MSGELPLYPVVAVTLNPPRVAYLIDVVVNEGRHPDVEIVVVGSYQYGPASIKFPEVIDIAAAFNLKGARFNQPEYGCFVFGHGNVFRVKSRDTVHPAEKQLTVGGLAVRQAVEFIVGDTISL
jgi:hypothetical protein